MYTPVQVTFYNTKNMLAEVGTEIQSNEFYFIEQKGKHGKKLLPALLVSTTLFWLLLIIWA